MSLLLETSVPREGSPWMLAALAGAAIAYILLRSKLRRRSDPLEAPPRMGLSQQRAAERDMANLLVEMSEMARQITAQLDTRSAKLELLIRQADERIAVLQEAAGRPAVNSSSNRGETAGLAGPAAPPAAPEPPDPEHVEVYQLADQGHSPQQIARRLDRPNGEIELILALRPSK